MRTSSAASTPASTLRNPTFDTPHIPTIRLTTATPTASEVAPPLHGTPSVLAPKAQSESRKRLVPKKSKLSLLVGNKRGDKGKDLSDVARRVGVPSSSAGRSFDIYVDPADDPDIGEIVVLKKKKSRGGLNDVRWAPLEEVTNAPEETEVTEVRTVMKKPDPPSAVPAAKSEDKEKWWTLGRSRRDSKELKLKGKENSLSRAKTFAKRPTRPSLDIHRSFQPEKTDNSERQRSHSFDGTRLLNGGGQPQQYPRCITVPMPDDDEDSAPPRRTHTRTMTSPSVFLPTAENPSEDADFAISQDGTASRNGSIALRAMRSVRSMARIGSWSQLKNMPPPEKEEEPEVQKPAKKHKKRTGSMRLSRGSIDMLKEGFTSIRRKSMDASGTMRSVSSQSTAVSSVWSDGTGRPSRRTSGSTATSSIHTNSSGETNIEPIIGRPPIRSSSSSIRWDDQTETIKEKHVRGSRRDSIKRDSVKKEKGSKKTLSGRRRPSLASLFSDIGLSKPAEKPRTYKISAPIPIPELLPFHVDPDSSGTLLDEDSVFDIATPKRVRPRPLSEDVFGRNRTSALTGDEDDPIQMLNEATSDLANLINRLDLEATPHATPRGKTPKSSQTIRQLNRAANHSPTGKNSKSLSAEKSTDSLRSYALRMRKKSQGSMNMLGKHPEPVPELPAIYRGKDLQNTNCEPDLEDEIPVLRLPQNMQRKSTSPSYPRTMPSYSALPVMRAASLPTPREMVISDNDTVSDPSFRASSSLFVGHSSKTSTGTTVAADMSYNDDYKPKRAGSVISQELSSPLLAGLRSTGTRSRRSSKQSTVTSSAKDFDIPAELQQLLRRNFNRDSASSVSGRTQLGSERSFNAYPLPPSPGTPPDQPLPEVQAEESKKVEELATQPSEADPEDVPATEDADDDDDSVHSENDTKKSFDFTGELSQLTASAAGNRRSFVIQLEDAFKTPTKSNLRNLAADLGYGKGDASVEVPPVPSFRKERMSAVSSAAARSDVSMPAFLEANRFSIASDGMTSESNPTDEDVCVKQPSMVFSARADRSAGHLDRSFQFGKSRNLTVDEGIDGASLSRRSSINSYTSDKPLNLSDIIPPPSHESRRQSFVSVSEEESSLLQSILSKTDECSIISGSNRSSMHEEVNRSLTEARLEALAQLTTHSRRESEVSFSGLSTFSEIRRGFEFGTTRPVFYPPAQPSRHLLPVPNHQWRASLFSVASVSSYGQVIRPGLRDPFDFSMPVYAEPRPVSEDMSYTVDDTFSFMRHGLAQRQRVDSDASNFSFHPPPAFGNNQQRRNRRQIDSMISVASGPPVSLYNRGFSHYNSHKWTVEQSLALNANGPPAGPSGRLSTFQRSGSTESLASNYSAQQLGRPGIGDKMFDSAAQAHDYGVPLSMISASPSQLESSRHHTTFDSILDDDPDSQTNDLRERSILGGLEEERINHSLQAPHLSAPIQLRPVSVYSIASQNNSPKRDDDTMISMLGGGWVRRRSIGSTLQGSPCARAEKRQHRGYAGRVLARIPSGDVFNDFGQEELEDEPEPEQRHNVQLRLPEIPKIEIPIEPIPVQDVNKSMESIISSSRSSIIEHHFGEGRMDMARKGLLERQSLEDCCLSAEGEDTTTSRRSFGVFNRPEPAFRSRAGSRAHGSIDNNTPPLSISESSSQSSMSQHSIDLAKLDAMIANAKNAPGPSDLDKARLRPHGQGHRYRRSHVRASWTSSVYETIEEEGPELLESEEHLEESVSQRSSLLLPDIKVVQWENEDVGPALRKMLELQAEARQVLSASRNQWEDTPFSLFALQSFKPPKNPAGMQALLEHSQKAFGPLPFDLRGCHRRPRTTSRPSPYPRNRVFNLQANGSRVSLASKNSAEELQKPVESEPIKELPTVIVTEKPVPSLIPVLKPAKSVASFTDKADKTKGRKALQTIDKNNEAPVTQTRAVDNGIQKIVAAASRKGKVGKSPRKVRAKKENATENLSTKTSENLRIVRPRPKGRPALATRTLRI